MDTLRLAAALSLVALVAAAALVRRQRAPYHPSLARLPPDAMPTPPSAPLTAVYFTSRLCGPCKDTPGILRDAAPEVPAIRIWVHERPDLVRALGLSETPTLLLVDADLRIRYARAGNPDAAELWTYVREAWDSLDAEGRLERVLTTAAFVG